MQVRTLPNLACILVLLLETSLAWGADWQQAYDIAINADPPDYDAAIKIALILRDPQRVCRAVLAQVEQASGAAHEQLAGGHFSSAAALADRADSDWHSAERWIADYQQAGVGDQLAQQGQRLSELRSTIDRLKRQSRPIDELLRQPQLSREDLDRADPVDSYLLGCALVDRGRLDDALNSVFNAQALEAARPVLREQGTRAWQDSIELVAGLQHPERKLPDLQEILGTAPSDMRWRLLALACRAGRVDPERCWGGPEDTPPRLFYEKLKEALQGSGMDSVLHAKLVYEWRMWTRVYNPFGSPSFDYKGPDLTLEDAKVLKDGSAWWYAAEAALTLMAQKGSDAPECKTIFDRSVTELGPVGAPLLRKTQALTELAATTWTQLVGGLTPGTRVRVPPDPLIESGPDYAARVDRAAEQAIADALGRGETDVALGIAQQAKLLRLGIAAAPLTGEKLKTALRRDPRDPKSLPVCDIFLEYFVGQQRAWVFLMRRLDPGPGEGTAWVLSSVSAYPLNSPAELRAKLGTPQTWLKTDAAFDWVLARQEPRPPGQEPRPPEGASKTTLHELVQQASALENLPLVRILVAPDGPLMYLPLAAALPESAKMLTSITYIPSGVLIGGQAGPDTLDIQALWKLGATSAGLPESFSVDFLHRSLTDGLDGNRLLRLWGDPAGDAEFTREFKEAKDLGTSVGEVLMVWQKKVMATQPVDKWARYIAVQPSARTIAR